jgi:hypothetical protein
MVVIAVTSVHRVEKLTILLRSNAEKLNSLMARIHPLGIGHPIAIHRQKSGTFLIVKLQPAAL